MSARFWKAAAQWWAEGRATSLLIVTHSVGSTPGRSGFHMLVRDDGQQLGTVGGGMMERDLVELARPLAGSDAPPQLLKRSHREDVAPEERSGMICAGSQWIAVIPIAQTRTLQLAERARAGDNFYVDAKGWRLHTESPVHGYALGEDWYWSEAIDAPNRVFVIGSGHVGLALCQVLALTDFEVTCIDHRAEVATFQANQASKHCCPYETMAPHLKGGSRAYHIVVTTAYLTDLAALRTILRLEPLPRFIGLMGSAAKIKRIKAHLAEEGYSSVLLSQIQAPVGLQIQSQTPAEIAISIAAQLIQTANAPGIRTDALTRGDLP